MTKTFGLSWLQAFLTSVTLTFDQKKGLATKLLYLAPISHAWYDNPTLLATPPKVWDGRTDRRRVITCLLLSRTSSLLKTAVQLTPTPNFSLSNLSPTPHVILIFRPKKINIYKSYLRRTYNFLLCCEKIHVKIKCEHWGTFDYSTK